MGKNAFAYSSHEHQMAEDKALPPQELTVGAFFGRNQIYYSIGKNFNPSKDTSRCHYTE